MKRRIIFAMVLVSVATAIALSALSLSSRHVGHHVAILLPLSRPVQVDGILSWGVVEVQVTPRSWPLYSASAPNQRADWQHDTWPAPSTAPRANGPLGFGYENPIGGPRFFVKGVRVVFPLWPFILIGLLGLPIFALRRAKARQRGFPVEPPVTTCAA